MFMEFRTEDFEEDDDLNMLIGDDLRDDPDEKNAEIYIEHDEFENEQEDGSTELEKNRDGEENADGQTVEDEETDFDKEESFSCDPATGDISDAEVDGEDNEIYREDEDSEGFSENADKGDSYQYEENTEDANADDGEQQENKDESKTVGGREIGVDLGTTNSVVAYIDKNGATRFVKVKNETLIPSYIFLRAGMMSIMAKRLRLMPRL